LETLEVLALLHSTPGRSWSAKQVSDEMRSSPIAAETALGTLLGHGLVARDAGGFSFRPARPDLEEQIRRLLACYKDKRTGVIAAIFSAPAPAILSFAEAFKIKKGKSDG
jgi:hypothetical protein